MDIEPASPITETPVFPTSAAAFEFPGAFFLTRRALYPTLWSMVSNCRTSGAARESAGKEVEMKADNNTYRSWQEFEKEQRRRCGTFQLSLEELASDLYIDIEPETDEEVEELDFDI
jgi:hypothetical protein